MTETRPQPGASARRSAEVRLSELMAALSFSTNLGLGLDEGQRAETYWVTLLALVCTGESFELAKLFGDDVAFRSGMYHVGPSQLAQMVYVLGQALQHGRLATLEPGPSRSPTTPRGSPTGSSTW